MQFSVTEPAAGMVVIAAIVDGELTCATDETGAAEIYFGNDPEVTELVEAARRFYGVSARATPVGEFRKLSGGAELAA